MIVTTDNQFTFREAESGTYSSTFVSSFNGRDGVVVLTADDVTAALGYIPGTGSGTVTVDDVTGLQAALDSKQPVGDYATSSDLVTGLASKQPLGSYANAIHTHVIADVTGLQGALDGKAAVSHTHIIGDVTGLQSALDAKQPVGTYATGTGTATGTNTGDQTTITGNAGTATKLATARTINGVAFDGTGNITINAVDSTARVPDTRTISTTAPLSGGGTLAANRTLSISAATTLAAGSMSAEDKTKLDAISGTNTGDETSGTILSKIGATGGTTYLQKDGTWTTPAGSGGGAWGSITGTLSSQTDLQTALNAKSSLSGGNTFSGNQIVNGELTVTSTRTTGGDPQILFNVEKAATNGGVFGFRRTSSANQVLVAFETASGANPDGYFGTIGGVEDRIFFLSGAGGTGSFAIDPSGLMIGNGIDTGSFAASPTSISSAGDIKGTSLVVSGTVNATNVSNTNTGDETYSSITTKLAAGSGGGTSNFLRADGAFAPPPSGGGGTTTNAVTFNNAGAGAVSGTTFDGSAARTISYNTVGAAAATHTHAYTDINNVGTGTVMYRKTAGTGAAETQTLATLKTDLGLSGTNTGDQTTISGNAGSATVLQTARTINGTSFNGSANITVTAVNPFSATFNNSGTGVVSGTSHNGSAAQTISYNTIGAAPTTRTISTTAPLTGGGDLSANRTLAISAATTSAAGSMSSADKTKLDTVVTGTYTPTVAGLSNVDLVAAWPLQYVRVGNVVTVSGRVEIDATSVGSVTRISMSLPITTAFSGANQAGGVASSSADSSPAQVLAIYANPSSALVWFDGRAQSASSLGHWFSFTYQII